MTCVGRRHAAVGRPLGRRVTNTHVEKYGDFVLRPTERRQRRYKSTALGEQARCASGSALLQRQMQRLAGTELNSSPHCGLVSERRACGAEDTPMTMRPNGHRAPQRLYFGPDVNENWLIFGLVAGRQSSVGVPVIYCPDC